MLKKLHKFISNTFDKKVNGIGLAVFRITYSIVLLCEIAQMYYFRHLIFDKIPYLDQAEINFGIPIGIWFISVVFILFGAFTRWATVINYLFSLTLIGSITTFEYHVFYAYMGINFLIIFMPISQCFSLDRLFTKLKYSNTTFLYNPTKNVSQFFYYLLPFVGIGLVYFDSVFYELASKMWLEGLGSWHPSSLPMITHLNNDFLLNQEYLMKIVGWLTIVFETIFVFTFFNKKLRIPFFIIGLILHLGILIEFPIPWFALTVVTVYFLLVPVSIWQRIFVVKTPKSSLTFYYDSECPLCVRTKIIISHLDWFNKIAFKTVQFDAAEESALNGIDENTLLNDIHSVNIKGNVFSGVDTYIQVLKRIFYLYPIGLLLQLPGIYHIAKKIYQFVAKNRTTERCTEENCGYNPPNIIKDEDFKVLQNYSLFDLKKSVFIGLVVLMSFLQLTQIYNSWLIRNVKTSIDFQDTSIDKLVTKAINFYSPELREFTGITKHPVFSQAIHFDGYNHIIAVVYQNKTTKEEVWLPIIDKNGQPDLYIYGANWVHWTFRVNSPKNNDNKLNKGLQNFTAFWAHKNNIDLNNATFLIKVKKIDQPNGWEKDFLKKQITKPWMDGGFITWENKVFSSQIKDIEKL